MAGIYLHIPFCKRICAYCDFYRSADHRRLPEVVEAMANELKERKDYLPVKKIDTIYFGGGTPSLLSPEQLRGLLTRMAELFDCSAVSETTLEANPDDLTPEYLAALREMGFNRLSIGVQSLDDDCLRLMNRRNTASEAIAAVRAARHAGFDNITVDIIFGVPNFGGASLCKTLEGVLSLGVQHISAYHLTIEPETAFGRKLLRGELEAVDEATSEAEFARVHDTLTTAGFEHYEVSNYALSGFRAQHNASYWQGEPYLGIGPAAHSFDGESRCWNVSSVEDYLANMAGGSEQLTDRDRYNEYIMTGLRTADGIDPLYVALRFGEKRLARLQSAAAEFRRTGLLTSRNGRWAIPAERMLVSDAVIEALFESE